METNQTVLSLGGAERSIKRKRKAAKRKETVSIEGMGTRTYEGFKMLGQNTWVANFGYKDENIYKTENFSRASSYTLDFIPWGDNNQYPNQFLDLFTSRGGNPFYESVKKTHYKMLMGMGLVAEGLQKDSIEAKQILKMFSADALSRMCWDMTVFNACSLLKVYELPKSVTAGDITKGLQDPELARAVVNLDTETPDVTWLHARKLHWVYPVPISQLRIGAPQETESGIYKPLWYFHALDWRAVPISANYGRAQWSYVPEGYMPMPLVAEGLSTSLNETAIQRLCKEFTDSKSQRKNGKDDGETGVSKKDLYLKTLCYDTEYHLSSFFYPKVDEEGALSALQVGALVPDAHRAQIMQGAAMGGIMIVQRNGMKTDANGFPSKEELEFQKSYVENFRDQLAGAGKTGQMMFQFVDKAAEEQGVSFVAPPAVNDKIYIESAKFAMQAALTATGAIVPEMHGIISPTGFSSKSETLQSGWEMTEALTIAYRRRRIEAWPNAIAKQMGLTDVDFKLLPLPSPFVKQNLTQPVSV